MSEIPVNTLPIPATPQRRQAPESTGRETANDDSFDTVLSGAIGDETEPVVEKPTAKSKKEDQQDEENIAVVLGLIPQNPPDPAAGLTVTLGEDGSTAALAEAGSVQAMIAAPAGSPVASRSTALPAASTILRETARAEQSSATAPIPAALPGNLPATTAPRTPIQPVEQEISAARPEGVPAPQEITPAETLPEIASVIQSFASQTPPPTGAVSVAGEADAGSLVADLLSEDGISAAMREEMMPRSTTLPPQESLRAPSAPGGHPSVAIPEDGRVQSAAIENAAGAVAADIPSEVVGNAAASQPAASDLDPAPAGTSAPEGIPQIAAENPQVHSDSRERRHDDSPSQGRQETPEISTSIPVEFRPSAASSPNSLEPARPVERTEVVRIVERVTEGAVHLRATGVDRMELAVKLEGGREVKVSLHLADGRVTPVIRTESEALRQALEQNWAQVSQSNGDRSGRLNPPVFESGGTPSNTTDLNQQREGQRQRGNPESQPEVFADLRRFAETNRPRTRPTVPSTWSPSGAPIYA